MLQFFVTKLKLSGKASQTGLIISCSLTLYLIICCWIRPLQYKGILLISSSYAVILHENRHSGRSMGLLKSDTFWVTLLRAASQILSHCRRWSYCDLKLLFVFLIPNCSLVGAPSQQGHCSFGSAEFLLKLSVNHEFHATLQRSTFPIFLFYLHCHSPYN